jgi:nicotinamide mononucleotide transporter
VTEFNLNSLLAGVVHTSLGEWFAVLMGVIYIVLIVRRNRWGWVAGGISSLILAVLAARARLPMQSVLQFSYVAAAVYGWWSWAPGAQLQRIAVWHRSGHITAGVVCLLLSFGLAQLLAHEGYSAWPFLDSLVTCVGLFATWLVARVYLENWLYWIVIDAVSIYLFVVQGLAVTALLFAIYLVIAVLGFRSWLSTYRSQEPSP